MDTLVPQARRDPAYPMPQPHTRFMALGWSFTVALPKGRRPLAFHEAGHVVVFRWLGIEPTHATVHEDAPGRATGFTHVRGKAAQGDAAQADAPGDLHIAIAAAAFHAGLMAELLAHGLPWVQPIHQPSDDHRRAEELLQPCFGAHASGAHAFAQRVALHVLSERWCEVRAIAAELHARGEWASGRVMTA